MSEERSENHKTLRVLCNHPYFGSVWLYNARVYEDKVEGFAPKRHPVTMDMVYSVMNFKKSCMRKVEINKSKPIREWNES